MALVARGSARGRSGWSAPPSSSCTGLIPTYQAAHFGRVYAAYGGVFVVLSLLWGWGVDRVAPDRYDLAGAALCLLGVAVIMYMPRGA